MSSIFITVLFVLVVAVFVANGISLQGRNNENTLKKENLNNPSSVVSDANSERLERENDKSIGKPRGLFKREGGVKDFGSQQNEINDKSIGKSRGLFKREGGVKKLSEEGSQQNVFDDNSIGEDLSDNSIGEDLSEEGSQQNVFDDNSIGEDLSEEGSVRQHLERQVGNADFSESDSGSSINNFDTGDLPANDITQDSSRSEIIIRHLNQFDTRIAKYMARFSSGVYRAFFFHERIQNKISPNWEAMFSDVTSPTQPIVPSADTSLALVDTDIDLRALVFNPSLVDPNLFQPNDLVISFRGSVSVDNFVHSNMNMELVRWSNECPRLVTELNTGGTCSTDTKPKVHKGFFKAVKALLRSTTGQRNGQTGYNALRPMLDQLDGRLFITGHSLGGAMAVIMGMLVSELFGIQPIVYTFGQPRLGNDAFGSAFLNGVNQYIRVMRNGDPIVWMPPKGIPGLKVYHWGAKVVDDGAEDGSTVVLCPPAELTEGRLIDQPNFPQSMLVDSQNEFIPSEGAKNEELTRTCDASAPILMGYYVPHLRYLGIQFEGIINGMRKSHLQYHWPGFVNRGREHT